MNYSINSSDASAEISKVLAPGEKLMWAGRPRQGVVLSVQDIVLIPASLLLAAFVFGATIFAIFGESPIDNTLLSRQDIPIWAVILAFAGIAIMMCVTIYLAIGRFLVDKAIRRNRVYGVTDRGVIIASSFFRHSVQRIEFWNLSRVTLSERSDGRGTITFNDRPIPIFPTKFKHLEFWHNTLGYSAFYLTKDVRMVYEMIQHAKQAALEGKN